MKKILSCLLVVLVICGCSQQSAYINIAKKFPNSKIEQCPYATDIWIVVDTNNVIWCIKDDGFNNGKLKPLFNNSFNSPIPFNMQ